MDHGSQPMIPSHPWQRKLYFKQPGYPDNYIPPDFLSDVNIHRPTGDASKRRSRRPPPALSALAFSQAIPQTTYTSFVCTFISIFRKLLARDVEPNTLLVSCLGIVIVGWIFALGTRRPRNDASRDDVKRDAVHASRPSRWSALAVYEWLRSRSPTTVVIMLPPLCLYLLSPLLINLTKATTDDTIWPLATSLFALSAVLGGFEDYREVAVLSNKDDNKSATHRRHIRRMSVGSLPAQAHNKSPNGSSLSIIPDMTGISSAEK